MRKNNIKTVGFVLGSILIMAGIVSSCSIFGDEEETITLDEAIESIEDDFQVDVIFRDVFSEVFRAAIEVDKYLIEAPFKSAKADTTGRVITISPLDQGTWPKTINIDYGLSNIEEIDNTYNRPRRGIIKYAATQYFNQVGCELTISFQDYYQDDVKVEGKMTIKNIGKDDNDFPNYKITLTQGKITLDKERIIQLEKNIERKYISGSDNENPWDDYFLISGIENGISSKQISYTKTIHTNNQLNTMIGCRWIQGGIVEFEFDNFDNIQVDYGESDCNNQAIIKHLGSEFTFEMD